jgi:hypothetical protein
VVPVLALALAGLRWGELADGSGAEPRVHHAGGQWCGMRR